MRFTPGVPALAAQWRGTPLQGDAKPKTRMRAPLRVLRTAGRAAIAALWPAPAQCTPASSRVDSVSIRPERPQSRTWLLARTQQSMPAAVITGTLAGTHPVVYAFSLIRRAVRHSSLEIDDPRVWLPAIELRQRLTPDVVERHRLVHRTMRALGEVHVLEQPT